MIDRTWRVLIALLVIGVDVYAGEERLESTEQSAERPESQGEADRAALYRKFAENLTGAALVGTYTTTTSQSDNGKHKPDRYQISKVTKLNGGYWRFHAKFGEISMPPLRLKVLWAGDTPVITMDKFTIPQLGTFSFRVLIDGDLYVGTWQHDEKGGHMLGRIERSRTPGAEG